MFVKRSLADHLIAVGALLEAVIIRHSSFNVLEIDLWSTVLLLLGLLSLPEYTEGQFVEHA